MNILPSPISSPSQPKIITNRVVPSTTTTSSIVFSQPPTTATTTSATLPSITTTTPIATNTPVILLDEYMPECFYHPPPPPPVLLSSSSSPSSVFHGQPPPPPRRTGGSSTTGSMSSTFRANAFMRIRNLFHYLSLLMEELWDSTDVLFKGRITWMLFFGPVVVLGDTFNFLDKSLCFALSGLALIPCAERLSYLTEQIAEHTNGTISALFNATFGNAPELLISVAALRAGYYRVIQLTMLGSMITNMIFVFGVSCIIGGIRYQTQSIRTISGNVTIGMLLMSTAGSLIPATLVLSGQFLDGPTSATTTTTTSSNNNVNEFGITRQLLKRTIATATPTQEEITLSRVNASVLIILYICYIIFQLSTHKDEFDEVIEPRTTARPNLVCRKFCSLLISKTSNTSTVSTIPYETIPLDMGDRLASPVVSPRGFRKKFSDHKSILPMHHRPGMNQSTTSSAYEHHGYNNIDEDNYSIEMEDMTLLGRSNQDDSFVMDAQLPLDSSERHRRRRRHVQPLVRSSSGSNNNNNNETFDSMLSNGGGAGHVKIMNLSKSFDSNDDHIMIDMSQRSAGMNSIHEHPVNATTAHHCPILSFRVSVVWLFIITLCVSAISDILVDTIDEFAFQMNLSQVFTSMIIIPFFSNVAEQVSAFIFAYRNEMDLVVGVTIGSAIQIATFVLPGSVLIGYALDRGMTLYFHSYETVCLLLCTLIVAVILQGGTTNWLVGAMLVGVYIMFAAGIWFHEIENLSIDTEELIDAIH